MRSPGAEAHIHPRKAKQSKASHALSKTPLSRSGGWVSRDKTHFSPLFSGAKEATLTLTLAPLFLFCASPPRFIPTIGARPAYKGSGDKEDPDRSGACFKPGDPGCVPPYLSPGPRRCQRCVAPAPHSLRATPVHACFAARPAWAMFVHHVTRARPCSAACATSSNMIVFFSFLIVFFSF